MRKNEENEVFPDLKAIVRQNRKKKLKERIFLSVLSWLAALILSLPFFAIVYQYVPEITLQAGVDHILRLDHALTAIVVILIIRGLIEVFKRVVAGIVLMCFIFLTINLFFNKYSYLDVYHDYKSMFIYLLESPVQVPFIPESASFKNGNKIRAAVVPDNPSVRNFAVVISKKHFNDPYYFRRYGKVIQYFSVFKEINQRWQYVFDPANNEYYAPAYESIIHLSGDCDDYSITMASCIEAIGGDARIIRTEGHLYPEVKICQKQDFVKYNLLIRQLFAEESKGKAIYYHLDADDNIWLNFDYTDHYPGGKFMNTKIIGILNL
ncbi:MAG TPA: transglutaminase [Bacteroidia bacterium]|mgnify:CR=1 FL=1|nr:transglutaminase [Bacteroidia bacterium]HRS59531.1 transglutaminase [Bacteroidia bacterium]HRU67577.1 transglutaminase [Bacteroidia bacterium]